MWKVLDKSYNILQYKCKSIDESVKIVYNSMSYVVVTTLTKC